MRCLDDGCCWSNTRWRLNKLEDGSKFFLDLASSIPVILALLQEGFLSALAHLFLKDFAEALRSEEIRLNHVAHTSFV